MPKTPTEGRIWSTRTRRQAAPVAISQITKAVREATKSSAPLLLTSEPSAIAMGAKQKSIVEPATELVNSCHALQQSRRVLAHFVDTGELGQPLIRDIHHEAGFLPIEGIFIDYKRDVPADRSALAKLVKHVLAFHNTYGGYLILGAEERKNDTEIVPVHKVLPPFQSKQIRDLCREYFSSPIEVQSRRHVVQHRDETYEIEVIHVPKRIVSEPVVTKRDAPSEAGAKPTFKRDEAYLRDGDNSIAASHIYHWRLLYGARPNPYSDSSPSARSGPIYNDLPDRSFICPEFIGRETILSELFLWLADDFSCVRVLAGEGGLGKTSIAYQFASEVSRSHLLEVEAVIWLTAKRQQFRALIDSYEDVSRRHFSTSTELFIAIAGNLGEIRVDWTDVGDNEFPKLLRDAAKHVRVFFIVDDLDSLEIDEQKRAIEVCQQLSGLGSRFLFTTRKNATASSASAIEVSGLGREDYGKLIESWQGRLRIKALTNQEVERLRDTTLGSPLYTESLLRLVKGGMNVSNAVAKWRGNLGIEVRNAALKREVIQLEPEARKVLVTTAILGEASLAEIKQCLDYSDATLVEATNELQSLFLIHAPSIADQPRFSISTTTRDLVLGLGPELISEYSSFRERITGRRYMAKGQKLDLRVVGIAINQANALLAARQPDAALRTVDEVNAQFGGKNRDLLFMRGRVLLKLTAPRVDEACKTLASAYQLGQRKPEFFGIWYDTEAMREHFETAVDVATNALDGSVGTRSDWFRKRAFARLQFAALQDKAGDIEHARTQLKKAADDLAAALKIDSALECDSLWRETFFRTHDSIWAISIRGANDIPEWIDAFETQLSAIRRGDRRIEAYARLQHALVAMNRVSSERRVARGERSENLIAQRTRWSLEELREAPRALWSYREFRDVVASVEIMSKSLNVFS